jgi:hypothetical protein
MLVDEGGRVVDLAVDYDVEILRFTGAPVSRPFARPFDRAGRGRIYGRHGVGLTFFELCSATSA